MKAKIIEILSKHSQPFLENKCVHEQDWGAVADEIANLKPMDKLFEDMFNFGKCAVSVNGDGQVEYVDVIKPNKTIIEAEYLELFNRIKKDFHQKRGKRCTPTRTLSKPAQLHTALKTYSMDELGKVILGVFGDKFHQDNMWKYATTSYCVRLETIEKYLK